MINEDLREAGRIPRTMEVELTADLGQYIKCMAHLKICLCALIRQNIVSQYIVQSSG